MRRANTILTVLIMVFFLLHAVFGSFQMIGVGDQSLKRLARVTVGLVMIHALIGIKLSVDSLRIAKKTGAPYFKENQLFWARRISGLAIMIMIFFHMTAFADYGSAMYRLKPFDGAKLAAQILLVAAIAVHVITNVKPLLIACGIRSLRKYAGDILAVLSIILLFFILAFIIYYLRWRSV